MNYFSMEELNSKKENYDELDRPIYGVYYIGCMGHYQSIVSEQMKCVVDSGLYQKTKRLLLFISFFDNDTALLDIIQRYDVDKKCTVLTNKENLYEKFAINNYKSYIKDDSYYLYYFHSKAVTREIDSVFDKRRKILNYYTLTQHKINIELLKTYDAVGCSLTRWPTLHFSGNFWWSKSEHLSTLPDAGSSYLDPEMYICKKEGKYVSLSQQSNDGNIEFHMNRNEEMIRHELSSEPLI